MSNDHVEENLGYTFDIAQNIIKSKVFRTECLRLLLLIYQQRNDSGSFDYYKIAKCQFYLNMPEGTASLLEKLVKNMQGTSYLDAYQIAFDICDKENQSFQKTVLDLITEKIANIEGESEESTAMKQRLTQIT